MIRLRHFAVAGTLAVALPTPGPAQPLEPGGSNYLAYAIAPAYLAGFKGPQPWDGRNPEWLAWGRLLFQPGGFQHVVGDYHLRPDLVRSQLRQMYAAGQRKVSLMMHLLRSTGECLDLATPAPDVCHTSHAYDDQDGAWGLAIPLDTVRGGLLPQHYRNLKNLLHDMQAIGFNQVNFRFSPFGDLDPRGWRNGAPTQWDQYETWLYDQYWSALRGTIDSVNAWVPDGDPLHVVYDLHVEVATYIRQVDGKVWNAEYSFGHVGEHTRRLWRDYLARYGNTRTIGFTFGNRVVNPKAEGWQRDVIAVMNRDVYDVVGVRPKAYAFDIYPNYANDFTGLTRCKYPCYDRFFEEIARQAGSDANAPQILVWEGLYNDKKFAAAVRDANRRHGLRIPYIMQWSSREMEGGGHFTELFPRDYDVYLKLSRP